MCCVVAGLWAGTGQSPVSTILLRTTRSLHITPSDFFKQSVIDGGGLSAVGWKLRGIRASYLRSRVPAVYPPGRTVADDLAGLSGRAGGPSSATRMAQAAHPAGHRHRAVAGDEDHFALSKTRGLLRYSPQDSAGDSADRPHRRDRHQQQLLAYLFRSGCDRCAALRALDDVAVDAGYFGSLLLVSLSRDAGIRVDSRGPWLPRAAHHVLLSGGHGGQPLLAAKPAPDSALSGTCGTAG